MWKSINGYEGLYKVSDTGQVWSIRREQLLKQKVDRYGYPVVGLSKDGKTRTVTIHRLVAEAFIQNPEHKSCVNHINEDKTDNRVENLEWVTPAENDNHGTRNERMAQTKSVKPVERVSLSGEVTVFAGVKDASRQTGIAHSQITRFCKGLSTPKNKDCWRYVI